MSDSSHSESSGSLDNQRIPGYRAKLPALTDSAGETPFPRAQRSVVSGDSPSTLKSVGKFELLEIVGQGAFGVVYRARDRDLDRIVAIKIPKNGQFASQEEEDRFVREARSVAQLNHPGIVPIHDVGHTGELPYLVAEFVDGVTLRDLLLERRLDFDEAADIAASIAQSLAHAHGRGVVHRDIKPANIMLERVLMDAEESVTASADVSRSGSRRRKTLLTCGRARLMDFGLSRRDQGDSTVTHEGQLLGTPAYMSPEQARGETQQIDSRSDVYSLGIILYEMLTEELPFRGSSRMVVQQVIYDEPTSPRRLASELPIDLETICLKCLEKDPAKRFQSSSELASELQRFLNGQPIQARPISSLGRGWRWCQRNPVVSGLLICLFLSMLVGLAATTAQWRRAETNARMAEQEAARANAAAVQAESEAERATQAAAAERKSRLLAEQAESRASAAATESAKQAATAQRVSDFMVGIFQGADRVGLRGSRFGRFGSDDQDPTARELLDRGTMLIEVELRDEPEIRAEVMATIAETYATLGLVDETDRMANSTIQTLRNLHGDVPHETVAEMLGLLSLARYAEGNYEAALPLGQQAIEIYDELYGETDPRGATSKLFYGMILLESNIDENAHGQAISIFDQVLAIRRTQKDADPTEIAIALVGKAISQRVRGQNAAAMMTLLAANRSLGDNPQAEKFVQIAMLAVRASVLWQTGQADEAKQTANTLIDEATTLLGSNHPLVAYLTMDQAFRMMEFGSFEAGEQLMLQGIAKSKEKFGRQPRTAKGLYQYGYMLNWEERKLDVAAEVLAESAQIYAEVLGRNNARTQQSLSLHSKLLHQLGREDEIEAFQASLPN